MFWISLDMRPKVLSGLDALDERRRLKLPDNSITEFVDKVTMKRPVSEAFARAYFDRASMTVTVTVNPAYLVPGDVVSDPGSRYVTFDPELSDERVRELWLASRR